MASTRFCIDYRKLNDVTIKDAHPLPRIVDMLESLRGARYFTTLDAAKGYWQIPMDVASIEKTAFSCSEGLFEFLVMIDAGERPARTDITGGRGFVQAGFNSIAVPVPCHGVHDYRGDLRCRFHGPLLSRTHPVSRRRWFHCPLSPYRCTPESSSHLDGGA